LSVLHNYFGSLIELFPGLYLVKFLSTPVKFLSIDLNNCSNTEK